MRKQIPNGVHLTVFPFSSLLLSSHLVYASGWGERLPLQSPGDGGGRGYYLEYFTVLIIDYSKLHGLSGEIPFLTDNGLTRVTDEIPFLTDETSRVILYDLRIATKFT